MDLLGSNAPVFDYMANCALTNPSGLRLYKCFYPHYVYVSDEVIKQLIDDGYKISKGEWLHGDYGLIIEW